MICRPTMNLNLATHIFLCQKGNLINKSNNLKWKRDLGSVIMASQSATINMHCSVADKPIL